MPSPVLISNALFFYLNSVLILNEQEREKLLECILGAFFLKVGRILNE